MQICLKSALQLKLSWNADAETMAWCIVQHCGVSIAKALETSLAPSNQNVLMEGNAFKIND